MHDLDDHDKKLLRLLQLNNKSTAEELGEIVNLSTSAVQRRLKRFRDQNIIESDVAIISPSVAGIGLSCVVEVVLREGDSRAVEKFKTSIKAQAEVMQCYYVTGPYDFVLIVNVKDMGHYETFSKTHLMDHPNVRHFYTHVVMDKVKVSYTVPI